MREGINCRYPRFPGFTEGWDGSEEGGRYLCTVRRARRRGRNVSGSPNDLSRGFPLFLKTVRVRVDAVENSCVGGQTGGGN